MRSLSSSGGDPIVFEGDLEDSLIRRYLRSVLVLKGILTATLLDEFLLPPLNELNDLTFGEVVVFGCQKLADHDFGENLVVERVLTFQFDGDVLGIGELLCVADDELARLFLIRLVKISREAVDHAVQVSFRHVSNGLIDTHGSAPLLGCSELSVRIRPRSPMLAGSIRILPRQLCPEFLDKARVAYGQDVGDAPPPGAGACADRCAVPVPHPGGVGVRWGATGTSADQGGRVGAPMQRRRAGSSAADAGRKRRRRQDAPKARRVLRSSVAKRDGERLLRVEPRPGEARVRLNGHVARETC